MISHSFFILILQIKRHGDVSRKRALHELLRTLQNAAVLEIKFDHNHDGLSEKQEVRQIFAGRCKKSHREFVRTSKSNHQARAGQHTEFQRCPQLSGPALSTSAILLAKEEGIISVT